MNCPKKRRLAALFAAVVMLIGAGSAFSAGAATQSELEQKLAQLQNKEKELKKDLSKASTELSASQQRKNLLDAQIDNAAEQIELLDRQLSQISAKVAQSDEKIADKEASIADTKDKLAIRLRTVVKTGNVSTLQMLLSTKNYTEYLFKAKAMQRIAAQDQAMIDELQSALTELEAEKKELEEEKAQLEKTKSASTAKKNELDALYTAAQKEVKNLQSTVSSYNEQLKKNQQEMEQTDREIERLIRESASTGSYNGGMMFWPVPTVRNYSSKFGERWGKIHKGLDIANGTIPIYGENIVAAASGTVIYVNKTSTWGGGYGYYVMVDHGKNAKGVKITTLYAHCSAVLVSVGQTVVGGKTVLARAGRTGNVTGPHLHFEVRENGKQVDPLGTYVSPRVN